MQADSRVVEVPAPDEDSQRLAELFELFQEHLNAAVPDEESDLIESGLLDSLMLVELLVHLETRYGICIAAQDLELDSFRSLHGILGFVDRHRRG